MLLYHLETEILVLTEYFIMDDGGHLENQDGLQNRNEIETLMQLLSVDCHHYFNLTFHQSKAICKNYG